MTKEQYRKSILQLVYGSFKSQAEGTTTENESSIINAITDLIVEDSFASYVPEHTEIIPSNFSTIWSYYRCSVNDFFKNKSHFDASKISTEISHGDLHHYLALSSIFCGGFPSLND